MPIADATENRILDALMVELAKIGLPPSTWLTTPEPPRVGSPNDAVNDTKNPQVFLEHTRTEPQENNVGTAKHVARAFLTVWCVAGGPSADAHRAVLRLKADALRALYAAEGTLAEAFQYGVRPGPYQFYLDLASAGLLVGGQEVYVDFEMSHTEP